MSKLIDPERVKIRNIKIEKETEKAIQAIVPITNGLGKGGTFKIWLPKSQIELEGETVESLTVSGGRKKINCINVIAPNWLISKKEDDINDFFESKGNTTYHSIAAIAI